MNQYPVGVWVIVRVVSVYGILLPGVITVMVVTSLWIATHEVILSHTHSMNVKNQLHAKLTIENDVEGTEITKHFRWRTF